MSPRRRCLPLLGLALGAALGVGVAHGEPPRADPESVTSLAGTWRFRIGDDPAWADPDFDDSSWKPISVPVPAAQRTDFHLAWYRHTLYLDPPRRRGHMPVAVSLGGVDSAYELYAGGRLVGGVGALPPADPRLDYDRRGTFLVPPDVVDADGRLVLALRVWKSPVTAGSMGGPLEGAFLIGPFEQLIRRDLTRDLPSLFLAGYFLILGLIHGALFQRRPQHRAYLYFALLSLGFAVYWFLRTQWKYALLDDFVVLKELEYLVLFAILPLFFQVVLPLLGRRIGKVDRAAQGLGLLLAAAVALPGLRLNLVLLPWWTALLGLVVLLFFWHLVRSDWRQHPEIRWVALGTFLAVATFAGDVFVDYGLYRAPRIAGFGFALFVLTLAASLAGRFSRVYALVEKLQRKEEAAERADRAKSEFLANMSHEIRTPMTGILGVTELLAGTELTPQGRKYLGIIRDSGRSLLSIVDDILDFTKIEAGRLRLETIDFSLAETVGGVIDLMSPRALEKGLDLVLDLDDDLPRRLQGDPLRLRQVLLNLTTNAVKFTDSGEVRLEVCQAVEIPREDGRVGLTFLVSDTGIGMEPEVLEGLFVPFSQGDASTTRKFGGTGLGLVISRRIVEAMGGELRVTSTPGQGSTFRFSLELPVGRGESAGPSQSAEAASPDAGPSPGARILVAEDHPVNRLILEEQLAALGHRPTVVENGGEAVDAVERETFDLVLMDCQMPELDGYEATARIRRREAAGRRHLPIIALTAHAMEGDREKCLAAGMDDYLPKPFTQEELDAVLGRWLLDGRESPSRLRRRASAP